MQPDHTNDADAYSDTEHQHGDDQASEKPCALRLGKYRNSDERIVVRDLQQASIEDVQLVPWGSNYTFATALERPDGSSFIGIYKPERGEAPLWDFPRGTLYKREYASYVLSRLMGWRFVPPTVIRQGPLGIGTLQLYIEPAQRIFDESIWQMHRTQLEQIALFDIITNNADRKPSHYFIGRYQPQVWGIDHGLTFNMSPKLRTAIWEFCGDPITEKSLATLRRIERQSAWISTALRPYLSSEEIEVTLLRVRTLLENGIHPLLNTRRNIPYGW